MSRIRSVHPGFFTDEDLVQVSRDARLFFVALGTQADDKGAFEWKPTTLKMRLFPADTLDIEHLLTELVSIDALAAYEVDGRKYGAIRNFRKFQRPKSPNDIHPMPDKYRNYVGLPLPISETLPPNGETSPQMEEGGKDVGGGGRKKPVQRKRDLPTELEGEDQPW
jgi:hypothetical protein